MMLTNICALGHSETTVEQSLVITTIYLGDLFSRHWCTQAKIFRSICNQNCVQGSKVQQPQGTQSRQPLHVVEQQIVMWWWVMHVLGCSSHVTGVLAVCSAPLLPTHVSTAVWDLTTLELWVGRFACQSWQNN